MSLVLHLRPTTYDKQEWILKLDDLTDCTGNFSGFEMALAAGACFSCVRNLQRKPVPLGKWQETKN